MNFDLSSMELIHGDVLEELERLPKESISLVVTSPPYNIGKAYESKTSHSAYMAWQTEIASELERLVKPGASIAWQVGNSFNNGELIPLDAEFYRVFRDLGFKLRNRIVWTFGHGHHTKNRFSGRHETILWFTKGDDYTFNLDSVRVPVKYPDKKFHRGPRKGQISSNPLGKNPGDVWDIPNVKALHVEKTQHPCQFPVALVERLVLSLTNPDDVVLDPFIGSGTSAIAALMHGRAIIGIDRSKEYLKIANERIASLMNGTLQTRPLNKPIFEPGKK